jgi:hypothetical protein
MVVTFLGQLREALRRSQDANEANIVVFSHIERFAGTLRKLPADIQAKQWREAFDAFLASSGELQDGGWMDRVLAACNARLERRGR